MRVMVFGATGGLGKAVSQRLISRRDEVLLVGRDGDELASVAEELNSAPYAIIDEKNPNSFLDAFATAAKSFGKINGVVNCIGTFTNGMIQNLTLTQLEEDVLTNVRCAFMILNGASAYLDDNGSIVFTSSIATQIGIRNHAAICASKGAIEGMARGAAAEFAVFPRQIRVNTVALGLTKTEPTKKIWDNPATLERLRSAYPLGINNPEEVAEIIESVLLAKNMTGQVITVDGGFTSIRI